MKSHMKLLVAFVPLFFSLEAVACGDSLYRVGKGVAYRVYTAPLPGSVLVYGQSEGAKLLAEALAKSGHGVRYVEDESELTSELSSGDYDVVIAAYSERNAVEGNAGASADTKTTYLPVALSIDEAEAANESYARVMVAEHDEIKHYLKAIHKTLKEKS